ncbi:hypothetical protein TcWFU_004719 [Taenia crassiceps]|uniref:Uncharacterized protein n=1 Tax=Taenia crassiceps TaxID=6207 RepID=A0ABR4PZI9_9CEST
MFLSGNVHSSFTCGPSHILCMVEYALLSTIITVLLEHAPRLHCVFTVVADHPQRHLPRPAMRISPLTIPGCHIELVKSAWETGNAAELSNLAYRVTSLSIVGAFQWRSLENVNILPRLIGTLSADQSSWEIHLIEDCHFVGIAVNGWPSVHL